MINYDPQVNTGLMIDSILLISLVSFLFLFFFNGRGGGVRGCGDLF